MSNRVNLNDLIDARVSQALRVPTAKTATYTAVSGDIVLANATGGAFTVTLPAASLGRFVTVKKTDSSGNVVTVTPASGTIDGLANKAIAFQYQSFDFVCDGTNWWLV